MPLFFLLKIFFDSSVIQLMIIHFYEAQAAICVFVSIYWCTKVLEKSGDYVLIWSVIESVFS